jgi:photosystem II stability/assembly factor-like uncharacterized protein
MSVFGSPRVARCAAQVLTAALLAGSPLIAQQSDSSVFAGLHYRHIGPQGNRASAVVGVPGDPMVAYIGAASGGVWKTADGGVTWDPTFDDQPAQAIGALAIAPSAPNVVWAGTGETFIIRPPTSPGDGIYKSTDGGTTWKRMGLERSGHIGRIVVHPTNPDVVYACALGHAYGPQQERGVYRTTDGGATWQRILFVDPHTGCADLAMDATDPDVLLAGMWQLEITAWNLASGGPGSGVFRSRDGGATWQRLAGHGLPAAGTALGKVAVAIAPSNPDRLYALIEQRDPTLYTSRDGGQTWQIVSRNHDMAERAPYYTRFAVSPDDENLLYFVSVRFSVSKDGGATLAGRPRAGGDNHDVWIDPLDADRYMVAHDGGASITLNRGKTFQRVVPPIAQMYHAYTDNRVPYYVYGNRQDGYSYRGPSNSRTGGIVDGDWQSYGGCESGFGVPDTVTNTTVWSGCYDGGLEIDDLETGHARNVRVWPEAGYGWPPADLKYRWYWTFPIAISPHDPHRVYVGSQYVHLTTDGGASWTVISPDLTRNDKSHEQNSGGVAVDNLMTYDGAVLTALAESPVEAGVLWAGSNDGLVHVSRDAGKTWTEVTANLKQLPPWGMVSRIEPSHFDGGTAYLAVDLHQAGADFAPYVYKTADYGNTWKRIDAGIPRSVFSYVHIVTEDPARRGLLYAGTENGLYYTRDDGAHWQPLQLNLPHAPVSWITVQPHFGDLVVATYGRGIWILDDLTPVRELDSDLLSAPLHLFSLRPAYRFRAIRETFSAPASDLKAENPTYGANIDYYVGAGAAAASGAGTAGAEASDTTAEPRARIVILGAAGDTVQTFEGPARPGVNRAWWNLRYASARQVRLRTPPPGRGWVKRNDQGWRPLVSWDLDLSTRGPLAQPGSYTVIVRVGDRKDSGTVTVLKDPNTAGSDADVRQQVALALEIRDDLTRTADLINRIEWVKQQLAELRTLLRDRSTVKDSAVARDIMGAAQALEQGALAVEGELYDVNLTGAREDAFRAPMKLYGRFSALLSDVAENGADFAPTTQQRAVHDLLHGRLEDTARKFDAWLAGDVAAFRAKVRAADLPDVVP